MRNPEGFSEPGIVPIKLDVTDPESVIAAARIASDVTLLVNHAGIAEITESPFSENAEDQARRIFETNYYGLVTMQQRVDHLAG
ncbi:SDR family NAD(P)-dependent oxidoreductase [Cupriavidus sp. YAF13]|uniref:SDR family NAD(P)-dependent oxidoreductase n=1 Tax=Cupriavidus sp. YAF13 TaxID=3233075 RepID=UPI003F8E428E